MLVGYLVYVLRRWDGLTSVENSYAVVRVNAYGGRSGPLVGWIGQALSYENCYGIEIMDTSNKGWKYTDSKAEELTEEQFADESNFEGWDFTNTWIIKDGYPELRMFLRD